MVILSSRCIKLIANVQEYIERSREDELMVKKTIEMLKNLNKEGIKFNSRKINSLQVAKEDPSLGWITIVVVSLAILIIIATIPIRISSMERRMMQIKMKTRTSRPSRDDMAR
jgi:hypothetical protein